MKGVLGLLDQVMEWIWLGLDTALQLLMQPFYYISILLIALFYRRQMLLERKLFHVRLHSWTRQTLGAILGGLAAGAAVSVIMAFLGISLTMDAVICIWVTALVLMLFRIRFLCFAYSIGLLGVIQAVIGWLPDWQPEGWLGTIHSTIVGLDIPALLGLAAVLHFAEALLIRLQGPGMATPLFLEGKRGKVVGGYQMQGFWPLPLFLLVPAAGGSGLALPWTPFFSGGGDGWAGGVSMMALPVLIGFGEISRSLLPKEKAALTSKRLIFYSALMLMLSLLAEWWSPLVIAASLAAIVLHEGLIAFSRQEESNRSPAFVHPLRGLKVMAVLPGSAAEELGIQAGEVILKVNGTLVNTKEEFHKAIRQNSAFCKLEVQNLHGESKFMQRAIYAGEHHQLGAILAPDPDSPVAVRQKPLSVFSIMGMKTHVRSKAGNTRHQAAEEKPKSAEM